KGVFADVVEEPVTFVNAPLLAAERGVELGIVTSADSPEFRNLVTVRGTLATGAEVSGSGTLSGPRHVEKLTDVDGFDIDVVAADGCRLAVHSLGDGPPLLCVPGGPGRAAEYLEDLGGLSGSRRLLLLDNRGTGGSELPPDRSSLQFPRLADDLDDVRRELEL